MVVVGEIYTATLSLLRGKDTQQEHYEEDDLPETSM